MNTPLHNTFLVNTFSDACAVGASTFSFPSKHSLILQIISIWHHNHGVWSTINGGDSNAAATGAQIHPPLCGIVLGCDFVSKLTLLYPPFLQKAQYEEKRASILDQILEPAAKERYFWTPHPTVCFCYLFWKLPFHFDKQTVAFKHCEKGQGPRYWRHSYHSSHLGQAAWTRKFQSIQLYKCSWLNKCTRTHTLDVLVWTECYATFFMNDVVSVFYRLLTSSWLLCWLKVREVTLRRRVVRRALWLCSDGSTALTRRKTMTTAIYYKTCMLKHLHVCVWTCGSLICYIVWYKLVLMIYAQGAFLKLIHLATILNVKQFVHWLIAKSSHTQFLSNPSSYSARQQLWPLWVGIMGIRDVMSEADYLNLKRRLQDILLFGQYPRLSSVSDWSYYWLVLSTNEKKIK